jgi:hypothetical protein
MRQAGWAHNDVVDDGSRSPRNLLWNYEGRPVLIHFVTARRHTCKEGCGELMRLHKGTEADESRHHNLGQIKVVLIVSYLHNLMHWL